MNKISKLQLRINNQAMTKVAYLEQNSPFLPGLAEAISNAEEGIGKLFPKRMSRNQNNSKINRTRQHKMDEQNVISIIHVLPGKEGGFFMPLNKKYIDTISLQKILSIKAGSLSFKKAHFLSIFTNRRAIVFTGSGASAEEAKFMADLWYHEWRKDQKHKNIAVKILDKEYDFTLKTNGHIYAEVKIKYAFKVLH